VLYVLLFRVTRAVSIASLGMNEERMYLLPLTLSKLVLLSTVADFLIILTNCLQIKLYSEFGDAPKPSGMINTSYARCFVIIFQTPDLWSVGVFILVSSVFYAVTRSVPCLVETLTRDQNARAFNTVRFQQSVQIETW